MLVGSTMPSLLNWRSPCGRTDIFIPNKVQGVMARLLEIRLGTPGASEESQSRAPLREHVSQADGRQTVSRCTGSGKVCAVFGTACWPLLHSGPPEYWLPDHVYT